MVLCLLPGVSSSRNSSSSVTGFQFQSFTENVYKSVCWPVCKWRVKMQNCKLEECYISAKVCLMFHYFFSF